MKLMTKEIEAIIKPLYWNEENNTPSGHEIVAVKFFSPVGRGTWFITEGEKRGADDWMFYGFCLSPLEPDFDEWGYSTLKEFESARLPFGLTIERDMYFGHPKVGFSIPEGKLGHLPRVIETCATVESGWEQMT